MTVSDWKETISPIPKIQLQI